MVVWLNIDKLHRAATLHAGTCDDVLNRDRSLYKSTAKDVDNLYRDGGWVQFESRAAALEGVEAYRELRRRSRAKIKEIDFNECTRCGGQAAPSRHNERPARFDAASGHPPVRWITPVRLDELPDITHLIRRINARAAQRADADPGNDTVGRLWAVRQRFKPKSQRSDLVFSVPEESKSRSYTFHRGGRTELQFNVGYMLDGDMLRLRFGVAFSLETSARLFDPLTPLLPLIRHFNDYVGERPEQVSDLSMWSERGDLRSPIRPAGWVWPEEATLGTFIFVGRLTGADPTDDEVDDMLARLDRLLPLFEAVMRRGLASVDAPSEAASGPGGTPSNLASTQAVWSARVVDVRLRHNEIQCALNDLLREEPDIAAVEFEGSVASGGRFDHRVRHVDGTVTYYEVKTGASASACIRQAVGQLLEYAYWTDGIGVRRLVVVGDVPLRPDEAEYLDRLRATFGLPLDYQRVCPP